MEEVAICARLARISCSNSNRIVDSVAAGARPREGKSEMIPRFGNKEFREARSPSLARGSRRIRIARCCGQQSND